MDNKIESQPDRSRRGAVALWRYFFYKGVCMEFFAEDLHFFSAAVIIK